MNNKMVDDQVQRILAYSNFDSTSMYVNCEECGKKIPVELTLCDNCRGILSER